MTIQYKFPFSIQSLESFESNGVVLSEPETHIYSYFRVPNASTDESVLRIKFSKKGSFVDLKEKNKSTGDWIKRECRIDDVEAMKRILAAAGSTEVMTFEKVFRTWSDAEIRMDVVDVVGFFSVLEIKFESENEAKARDFISAAGLDVSDRDTRSVLDIYLDMKKAS